MANCIYVLTSKSTHHMGRLGGTASWSLNPSRASSMGWVVCFEMNPHGSGSDHFPFLIGEVGPISVSPEWDSNTQKNKRYLIQFERVAVLPDEMQRQCKPWREIAAGRNPVKYGALTEPFEELFSTPLSEEKFLDSLDFVSLSHWRAELGIDPTERAQPVVSTDLQELTESHGSVIASGLKSQQEGPVTEARTNDPAGISVDEAKRLLATRHNVPPENIEIKITF